ncbi:hypothetical protein ALNOE001_12290 [Candidatus Methanobinarius endosymbioticus]|uniref:Uncharacterized protein n=1 Tax=Candidatus Methanobinarius endosymbioticus TaxID=2006182 RepID=A0A366MBU4_9EURY|nr:hypothetical protein ALNOE001_12290 [Candidatus Methanobinarius endosymbioticus]
MNKGKIAILFTISIFLSIGMVSAAQYDVNETTYSYYFDDDGSLKNNVLDDDTLVFNGEISKKNFKLIKDLI